MPIHNLAVVGSRTWTDKQCVFDMLDCYYIDYPQLKIISGGAKGADSMAADWAKSRNVPTQIFRPDWDVYGKRAGFMRNEQIVRACDSVLAFWDGTSKGTLNTIDKARDMQKPVRIIYTEAMLDAMAERLAND